MDIEDVDGGGYDGDDNGSDSDDLAAFLNYNIDRDVDNIDTVSQGDHHSLSLQTNLTPEQKEFILKYPVQRKYSSIAGLSFSLPYEASPRIQMLCSHISQSLTFDGMTPKSILSGVEQELGKSNFRISVPDDCIVREVIPYYKERMSKDSINYNPATYVLVQLTSKETPGYFDIIKIEDYFSMHQHFGFKYKDGKDLHKVVRGARMQKGDVLKESTAITENGDNMFGRELKAIMMTHRAVAEDGFVICEDVLPHFAFTMLEGRSLGFGKKTIPLNTYGDKTDYRFMPEIGQMVRPDGILMSVREIDEEVAISTQNVYSTQEVDHVFDESIYVVGGGRVVSLDVVCNNESEGRINDVERQLKKYLDQSNEFYRSIIAVDRKLRSEYGVGYKPSVALNALVYKALIATNINGTAKISKQFRRATMDDYTVNFVVERKVIPTYGFKFTDTRGRKGVCCTILPRSQMPKDSNGVSADIIIDPIACVNRMIMGGPIEAGLNVITDLVTKSMREALGIDISSPHHKREIKVMADGHDPRFEKAWQECLDYYKEVAPVSMYEPALQATQKNKSDVITYGVKHQLGLYLPPEENTGLAATLWKLLNIYKPKYCKVTYEDGQGNIITSKDNADISDLYVMPLEKIGDGRFSSNSVRFQVFGVPASASKHDRHTSPTRIQNGKVHGESEARPINSMTRPSVQAELMDRNNNPKSAELCYLAMITAPNASKIEKLIDRRIHPFGFTMPIQTVDHVTTCSGYRFVYKKDNPGLYTYQQMKYENSEENIYAIG